MKLEKYNKKERLELAHKYIAKCGVSMFKDNPTMTYEWLLNDLVTDYVFCNSVLEIKEMENVELWNEKDILYIERRLEK